MLRFREGMFSNVLFRCGQGRQRKREGRGGSQQCWRKLMLFSPSVVSDSLQPHGLQHARLPCPSLSPWACSDSWPMSWWCHPAISSSVTPFYSCPQSFMSRRPLSSFPVSQRFTSGGQSIGASASASVLPVSFQGWFPLGLTCLISCARAFFRTTDWKPQFFCTQPSLWFKSHFCTTGKTITLSIWTFVSKVMSLLFSMLSRFVTSFLPRSKHLLISWLQSPSTVILEPESVTVSIFLQLIAIKWWDQMPWSLFFECYF